MPAGFYALNDSDTVLIDDTNFNLAMHSRDTSTVALFYPAPGVVNYSWVVDTTSSGFQAPVIAFACAADYASANYPQIVTSTRVRSRSFAGSVALGATVKWAIFDKPVTPGAGAALRIWNGAGQLCFDSRLKHPVIAAVIVPTVLGTVYTETLPSGREYMCVSAWVSVKIASNVVSVVQNQASMLGQPCVIIDVTGY